MIDMNMMQHKVELTYKELYELTYEWNRVDKYADYNCWDKWIKEHHKLSNILVNLMRINQTINNFKYEIGERDYPTEIDFIGYLDENNGIVK